MNKHGLIALLIIVSVGAISLVVMNLDIYKTKKIAVENGRPAEIELTIITDANCELCSDPYIFIELLEKENVEIQDVSQLAFTSEEAKTLILELGIKQIPAIVATGEVVKGSTKEFFETNMTIVNEVAFLESTYPVFIDVATEREVGHVSLMFIDDESCTDCYDPSVHKTILVDGFSMVIDEEKTVDAGSRLGREMIDLYKIESLPTVILTGDMYAYSDLNELWETIGSKEEDGAWVFRKMESMGKITYKNLLSGLIEETIKE